MNRASSLLNLGQAVAICLYELVREPAAATSAAPLTQHEPRRYAPAVPPVVADSASAADLDRLTTLLTETLDRSGYMSPPCRQL